MEKTRVQDIYMHLKKAGFDVYFPTQHQGECIKPYVVIKDVTTTKYLNYSSTVTYYDIMCYVPSNQYSIIEEYVDSIKESMKQMIPMIKPTYSETESYYDDSIKGYMKSIQYKNYKQII